MLRAAPGLLFIVIPLCFSMVVCKDSMPEPFFLAQIYQKLYQITQKLFSKILYGSFRSARSFFFQSDSYGYPLLTSGKFLPGNIKMIIRENTPSIR